MSSTKICRYCGNIIDVDAQTCEYCGNYLCKEHDNKDLFCSKCKAPVNTDDNFCQKCGAVFRIPDDSLTNLTIKHNIMGIPYHLGILLTSLAVGFAITVYATSGKDITLGGSFIYFCIAFLIAEIILYIYFLPSIIAIENNHKSTLLIYIFNLLSGITIIGWFITLIFALQSKPRKNDD